MAVWNERGYRGTDSQRACSGMHTFRKPRKVRSLSRGRALHTTVKGVPAPDWQHQRPRFENHEAWGSRFRASEQALASPLASGDFSHPQLRLPGFIHWRFGPPLGRDDIGCPALHVLQSCVARTCTPQVESRRYELRSPSFTRQYLLLPSTRMRTFAKQAKERQPQ